MKKALLIFSIASAFLHLAPVARAAAGDLDPGFAGTGKLEIGFGRSDDYGRAVGSQPDGKIVMAGITSGQLVLVRFGTNNMPDPTFGSGGVTQANLPGEPQITGLAVQADGKIVVAGWIYVTTDYDFLLAQFNPDGMPDASFGNSGVVIQSYGHRDECKALLLQSDGKIVVAGSTQTPYPDYKTTMVIARFHPDGLPDLSFHGNGSLVETNSSIVSSLAQQSDGKILLGASLMTTSGVFRLNMNGTRDTSFATVNLQMRADALAIQPGYFFGPPDRIVAAAGATANGQSGVKVARLSLNGTLDSTFNTTGTVFKAVGPGVAITGLSGGFTTRSLRQILVTGHYRNGATSDFMLLRFTDVGAIDSAFGNGGIVTQSLTDGDDQAYDMVIQPGMKVLLAGTSTITADNHDFALARFNWSDGSLDTNFNGTGILVQNITDRPAMGKCVAIQPDGKIVAGGACQIGFRNAVAVCRLHPDGTLDDTFGDGGRVVTPVGTDSSEASAIAIQPDGKIVIAGMAYHDYDYDGSVMLVRYLANGALDNSFGSTGTVVTVTGTNGSVATAMALQADGKIVVGGRVRLFQRADFLVMRYRTDGSLDNTWNGTGKVTTGVGPEDDELSAIAIQGDGKIIAAGGSYFTSTAKFTAVRYNANGSLDQSFGSFGRLATQLGSSIYDLAYGMALEPDGKIVLGGFSAGQPPFNIEVGLLRLNANGAIDATFDGDGVVTTSIGLSDDYALRLAKQSDGKTVAACRTQMGSYYRFGAVRLTPTGSVDAGYGFGGVNFYDFGTDSDETLNDMALDARNRLVMIGEVGGRFGILRVQSDPVLRLNSIAQLANGHVLLKGEGVPGLTHTLQKSAALATGSFSFLAPVTAAASGQWQYEDPNYSGASVGFYRLSYP